jgi:hypothetical protein
MILKQIMKPFEMCDEGSHLAVLADVVYQGTRNTKYGPKEQLRFKWFVQQIGTDGKELSVISTYNYSLGQGANLVKAITAITGKVPTDGFDTESLIGANNRITVEHHPKADGRVFPDVIAILRPGKNDPKLSIPHWFKRAGGDNTPPATGAATAPAPKPPAPKPATAAVSSDTNQNDNLESCPDEATSFPADNSTAGKTCKHAA